jgi:hypothetical protein
MQELRLQILSPSPFILPPFTRTMRTAVPGIRLARDGPPEEFATPLPA